MPHVPLELIDPNPFRDFDLHPIDQAQVEKLKASIGADGFWASVTARAVGDRYQLAFGHHRIEAARAAGLTDIPIDVRELTDWQMVRLLASENATQRGTTAAASLDAVAAISRLLANSLVRCDEDEFSKIFDNLSFPELRGRLLAGSGIGEPCILAITPKGAFTTAQVRLALGILKDSGRMNAIIAQATGSNEHADAPTFDANCARLFKLDYHLAEFRRIVTGDVVRSYLDVAEQFSFAQQIIAELGDQELTAIKLRERANVIFYEQLGMPRGAMRGSSKRDTDDRIKDALNLLRRGVHGIRSGSAMLATIFADGTTLSALSQDRVEDYADEMEAALEILRPQPRGRLRVITKRRDVA
jgi:hypothetical protein